MNNFFSFSFFLLLHPFVLNTMADNLKFCRTSTAKFIGPAAIRENTSLLVVLRKGESKRASGESFKIGKLTGFGQSL